MRNTLFDNLNRLTQSQQITDGQTYTSGYLYNLSGALVQETYPSGRVVKNEFESDGDLKRIFGNASNQTERTYANGFNYTADGKIQRLRLGNGRWESAKFNERLQVTELALGASNGDGGLWKLAYEYGELNTDGSVNIVKNTGNIAKQTVSFNGLAQPFIQTFKYDSLYRITEARETNNNQQTWKQTFGYDRFGNRTAYQKFIGTTPVTLDNKSFPQIDATTNRILTTQSYVFDKNGNLTLDAENRSFIFNGDNKQTEVRDVNNQPIGKYFYDGDGKRVKKEIYSGGQIAETTIFVYSGGKLVAEYSTAAPPTNPTTSYTATDQLGSPRVITNALGQVTSRRDFMPFGEELYPDTVYRKASDKYGATDSVRQRFTGYQKDTETGLDFAEARMYENRHGRFTAVDPLLASGKSANPQTFNRYVYVMNNPLLLTDPTGLQAGENLNLKPCKGSGCVEYTITGKRSVHKNSPLGIVEVTAVDSIVLPSASALQFPFPILSRGDEESSGTGSFEDFATNTKEFAYKALHSASLTVWNTASDAAPDYGKVQFRVPLVVDLEFSVDREFRPYGGIGTPLGSYGSRTDFNLMDSSRPKSFGFKPPSLSFGWFLNIDNSARAIGDAVGGANVSAQYPFLIGIGLSKSLPSGSDESLLTTPTAIEFGTPSGGFGISGSREIPCVACAELRNSIRNSRINPNNFGRPQN